MSDDDRDVPPWVEALKVATADDALARARRREAARKAGKGLWSVLGPSADPELAAAPAVPHAEAAAAPAQPVPLPEADQRDAEAVWLQVSGEGPPPPGGRGPRKV